MPKPFEMSLNFSNNCSSLFCAYVIFPSCAENIYSKRKIEENELYAQWSCPPQTQLISVKICNWNGSIIILFVISTQCIIATLIGMTFISVPFFSLCTSFSFVRLNKFQSIFEPYILFFRNKVINSGIFDPRGQTTFILFIPFCYFGFCLCSYFSKVLTLFPCWWCFIA